MYKMNRKLKRRLIALGLSCSMAAGVFLPAGNVGGHVIVSAKTTQKYKVNRYGVLTEYTGSSNVYIRANVSALTTTVFDGVNVTSFSVDSNNPYFKEVDGVLYTKDGKKLVRYPSGRKGEFVVPDTVTSIAQDAFRNSSITSIQLPNGVSSIGNSAFYRCRELENVNIPSGVKRLRKQTFYQCRSLKRITLPSEIQVLGDSSFEGCRSLETINLPSSLKKIGKNVFDHCKSLRMISIPNKVKKIPESAFNSCRALEKVNLSSNIEEIGYRAFEKCSSLRSISIPGSVDTISYSAFENCVSLRNVMLKNGISTIDSYAFYGCSNLQAIKLPNSVRWMGEGAFGKCSSLKRVTLSDQIRDLESVAFLDCVNLENVHLSKSLTEIGNRAFSGCTSLATLRIPKNVSTIGYYAFEDAVSAFVVDKANTTFSSEDGVLYNKDKTTLIKVPSYKDGDYIVPDTVKEISDSAFNSCHELQKVVIGEGVTELFKSCFDDSSIEEITLPDTLKVLKEQNVNINVPKLKSIRISGNNENFVSEDGILYTKDKTILCIYPAGKRGVVTFPAEASDLSTIPKKNKASKFAVVSGSSVYATDDGVLTNLGKSKIYVVPAEKKSYHMGRKMRNIEALYEAKAAMKNITKITVSSQNTKYSSKDGVLFDKYKKKIVFYPNAKKGAYTTPASVSSIKDTAFCDVSKLTALTVGKNVYKCSLDLDNCSNLKRLSVKEGSLRNLSVTASGTTSLKKVTLPTSLITANIYCSREKAKKVTIVGWTNTSAEKIAKKLGAKFVSIGLIPKQVKNVSMKAYVNLKVVKISWARDPQVSGYEIYSENKNLKTIKDNNITEASIYVGDDYYSTLYIRSYIMRKGKKIYGKSRKLKYYPYS